MEAYRPVLLPFIAARKFWRLPAFGVANLYSPHGARLGDQKEEREVGNMGLHFDHYNDRRARTRVQ